MQLVTVSLNPSHLSFIKQGITYVLFDKCDPPVVSVEVPKGEAFALPRNDFNVLQSEGKLPSAKIDASSRVDTLLDLEKVKMITSDNLVFPMDEIDVDGPIAEALSKDKQGVIKEINENLSKLISTTKEVKDILLNLQTSFKERAAIVDASEFEKLKTVVDSLEEVIPNTENIIPMVQSL